MTKTAIIVTVITVGVAILFSTEIFRVSTASQNAFTTIASGNVTSLSSSSSSSQYIIVKSNTHWEGSILDSRHDSTIRGSYGDASFDIHCNDEGGPYSVVFNKLDGFGYLTLSLVKNGRVIDTKTTTDSFGGVQVSGNCDVVTNMNDTSVRNPQIA